ncbi:MAG: hypothetical protein ACOC0J_03155, partial [Myxococcota bacterium]
MRGLITFLMLPALAGCLSVCPDSRDREAKERLFSLEEPSLLEQQSAEEIDASALAEDEDTRRRILWMSAAETAERLQSFKARTQVSFTWRRDEDRVRLAEEAVLEVADSGDFRVAIDNDRDFGMELRWIGETSFVKSRQGTFRERRADRAGHEEWREETLGQLRTLFELARGKVQFARTGAATHEGRPVVRYAVANASSEDSAVLPPPKPSWARDPVYPEGGPDDALLHRLAPYQRGEPVMISGEIAVDQASGAILLADLTATTQVPPPEGEEGPPARLDLRIDRRVEEIGRAQVIDVPEHKPFARRPRAVKEPLDWWPPYVEQM